MRVCSFSVLGVVLSVTACSSAPGIPPVIDPGGTALNYSVEDWNRDRLAYDGLMSSYRAESTATRLVAASLVRDRMVNRVRADIRSHHAEYEAALTKGIANWNILGDLTQLGLALAATVTKGEETKTILSAVIAATAGAKLSVDKNYYREKASEVLVSSMRTARLEKDTVIVGKLASMKADAYPLEEALCDLVDLYYAGTLTEAFQRLAKQVGSDAEQADEKAATLNENRAYLLKASDEQIQKRRAITAAIQQLTGAALTNMVSSMAVTAAPGANEDQKRRALIETLKQQTQGKDATDPVWKTWEDNLLAARSGGGG